MSAKNGSINNQHTQPSTVYAGINTTGSALVTGEWISYNGKIGVVLFDSDPDERFSFKFDYNCRYAIFQIDEGRTYIAGEPIYWDGDNNLFTNEVNNEFTLVGWATEDEAILQEEGQPDQKVIYVFIHTTTVPLS